MKRMEQVITSVHHTTTNPQTCSGNTREYAKRLANKSGASRVVNQVFEFNNGTNR